MRLTSYVLVGFLCAMATVNVFAQAGFVALPKAGDVQSVYILCNPTGQYGLSNADEPNEDKNNACAVSNAELLKSPMNAPLDGFRLVGMLVSDIEIPESEAGERSDMAVLTDAIWRNKENTQCILGTHLQMKDAPMGNGQYWEVNDIARSGFAGKEISVAYFHKKPSAEVGGKAEVLFRVGRTFSSVKRSSGDKQLPSINGAPAANTPISEKNTAAFSDNWVDFTTDLSFKDLDGVTREHSSIFYIKYACDAQDPVSKPGAIRFRTTGQSGQALREIAAPALVPADGVVDKF